MQSVKTPIECDDAQIGFLEQFVERRFIVEVDSRDPRESDAVEVDSFKLCGKLIESKSFW
jgi:hypothetical protein